MHILISDNNIEHRAKLVNFIEKQQYKVTEALTMDEIAGICKSKCPDLMIIDTKLPGGCGVDAVKQIRQLGGLATWNPIILITDKHSKEEAKDGLKAGADDYLEKPIDLNKLEYKIKSAARLQELKEDVFSIAHNLVLSSHAAMEVADAQDNMTGMLDIQAFHKHLEKEWFNARESKKQLSLMLINIDNFKEFNNIYGVEEGDRCIKQIADVITDSVNSNEMFVARTLGDNFGILIPKSNMKQTEKLANNILKAVNNLNIPNSGSHHSDHVTISIGIANADFNDQKQPMELLEAADYALYQAKHKGRNKVFSDKVAI